MRNVHIIRLENARKLAKSFKTKAAFANAIGKQPTQVSRFMGKNPTKRIGDDVARDIEIAFGLEEGYLDLQHYEIGISDINEALAKSSPRTVSVLTEIKELIDSNIELSEQEEKILKTILESVKSRHKE